jgi:hypothetical protein
MLIGYISTTKNNTMKKILLLLLIAPVLGFGQQLYFNPNSLQLTDVFSFTSFESQNTTMTVPQGKIWFIKTNGSIEYTFLLNGIPINFGSNIFYYGLPLKEGSTLDFGIPNNGNFLINVFEYNLTNDNFVLIVPNEISFSYTVPDGYFFEIIDIYRLEEYLLNGELVRRDYYYGDIYNSGDTISLENPPKYGYIAGVLHNKNELLALNAPNQTTPILYPNPTSSLLALNSNKEYDIEVYDMAGNKVMALTGNNINMAHLSTATYIVKATDKSNNEELTYKVVKN